MSGSRQGKYTKLRYPPATLNLHLPSSLKGAKEGGGWEVEGRGIVGIFAIPCGRGWWNLNIVVSIQNGNAYFE